MENFIYTAPVPFDYSWLSYVLGDYHSPRSKITRLIKNGEMIRVKKGLYIPGPFYNKPYSKEVMANLIYGPSCVSLEYALSYYQMIPERVEVVTSITPKRNKFFMTPAGSFQYTHVPLKKFFTGMILVKNGDFVFFMATTEKALCDTILKNRKLSSKKDLLTYLSDDLRLDMSVLSKLNTSLLGEIASVYRKRVILNLIKVARET